MAKDELTPEGVQRHVDKRLKDKGLEPKPPAPPRLKQDPRATPGLADALRQLINRLGGKPGI